MKNYLLIFREFDLVQLTASFFLLLVGLLMIYSTTLTSETSESNLVLRQIVFAILGLAVFFVFTFFDYRNLKKNTGWFFIITIFLLVAVWVFGPTIRGSSRWIDLGFFRFQPAEFSKLVMVIITAKFLDRQGDKIKTIRYPMLSLFYIAIPVILILAEPDLGSALIIFLTWLSLILSSSIGKKQVLVLFVLLIIIAVLTWFFILKDYQKQRLFTFLNPYNDPQGQGYNVLQSIIAVGSGKFFGRGLGRGLQSQLKFLPERQTDFIFASTAEELGFVGSIFILLLFCVLFYRLMRTIKYARDNFGVYLTLGIFFMLLFEVLINIGMNLGLLPVTGIPLPLLSYGGSSLITTFIALGLIQSVVIRSKMVRFGV